MSILYAFDRDGREIIHPAEVIRSVDGFPDILIATFSAPIQSFLLNTMDSQCINTMTAGGWKIPIYEIQYKDVKLGFYHSLLGGSAAAALLEEVFAMGAGKVLFLGSCGSLDCNITEGHFIVPTAAYRDEGTSYHYMEASDFIEIDTSNRLAEIFDTLGVPYVKAKTWSTDSFYRETDRNMVHRKEVGCAVVEMECASLMAVGQFRQKLVYQFLFAADCLDNQCWDQRILGKMPEKIQEGILKIALETAIRL